MLNIRPGVRIFQGDHQLFNFKYNKIYIAVVVERGIKSNYFITIVYEGIKHFILM